MPKKKDAQKKVTKKQRVDVKDLTPEELEQVSGGLSITGVKAPTCTETLVKSPTSVTLAPKLIVVY